ncbi:MAG: hypothetical protein OEU95_08720 [Nitrospirota bacterium]|nr:hypothetical protein [Nitrospirota bacterium]
MSVQNIKIKEILIDDSRFASKGFLFDTPSCETCHIKLFDKLGILYPVILYRDNKKQLHLVDGKKRLQYAKENRMDMVSAIVLPETTPVTDIIILILCNKKHLIESSVINKIQFIFFAASLNAPERWILEMLCVPFEFKPHSEFLQECERINNLPRELKLFCHEKRFSQKQLLNLTYHPQDLLMQLMQWRSSIQLTASTMDEIASSLKNYLRSHNQTIRDFLAGPEVNEIIESSLSPRDKTEKLRQLIHIKQFPLLSEANARMQKAIEQLDLPKNIFLTWDRTLENRNLDIAVHIRDPKKWQKTIDALRSEEVREAIEKILEEL